MEYYKSLPGAEDHIKDLETKSYEVHHSGFTPKLVWDSGSNFFFNFLLLCVCVCVCVCVCDIPLVWQPEENL